MAVFLDGDQFGRIFARDPSRPLRESFLAPHASRAALEDAAGSDDALERRDEKRSQLLGPGGEDLEDQVVTVEVGHDPGQAVALSVDEPEGGGARRQEFSP
ncbi:MAG: hypothetical protein KatS3mg076_2680 [Candidatus Binatia bacterium]|nr:MAG: hypothetical protein KatS3mg076_2680 [Candidatus Binatia bacterium]